MRLFGRLHCKGYKLGGSGHHKCPGVGICPNGIDQHPPRRVLVPVPAITREWVDARGKENTRTMLPLKLAFAITIHKSQGMTIPRLMADLGDSEMHTGGTFTVLSRAPAVKGLALERPLTLDRLLKVNHSKSLQERKLFEAGKWPVLQKKAAQHFLGIISGLLNTAAWQHHSGLPPRTDHEGLAMFASSVFHLAQYTARVATEQPRD